MKNNLLILLSAMVISFTADAKDQQWDFDVLLGDSKIGEHSFVVTNTDGQQSVSINASFKVELLFMTVYQYQHKNTEKWKSGCVNELISKTNDDGKEYSVYVKQNNNLSISVNGEAKQETISCIRSFSYWDKKITTSNQLINSQTGEIVPVAFRLVGNESYEVKGESLLSKRYEMKTDKFTMQLWYSASDDWLGLSSVTEDGHELRYILR